MTYGCRREVTSSPHRDTGSCDLGGRSRGPTSSLTGGGSEGRERVRRTGVVYRPGVPGGGSRRLEPRGQTNLHGGLLTPRLKRHFRKQPPPPGSSVTPREESYVFPHGEFFSLSETTAGPDSTWRGETGSGRCPAARSRLDALLPGASTSRRAPSDPRSARRSLAERKP